ncbi:unnamed protein product, partial [Amoebophrya sp. A25]
SAEDDRDKLLDEQVGDFEDETGLLIDTKSLLPTRHQGKVISSPNWSSQYGVEGTRLVWKHRPGYLGGEVNKEQKVCLWLDAF